MLKKNENPDEKYLQLCEELGKLQLWLPEFEGFSFELYELDELEETVEEARAYFEKVYGQAPIFEEEEY